MPSGCCARSTRSAGSSISRRRSTPEDVALAAPPGGRRSTAPCGAPAIGSASSRSSGAIGRGGMGVVYLATDRRLHRNVALKSLPAALAGNPELRERLKREARAAATITDPAVATVYSLEEVDGHLLLASEYLDGRTLRARHRRRARSTCATAAPDRAARGARPARRARRRRHPSRPQAREHRGGRRAAAPRSWTSASRWLESPGGTHHTKLTRAGAMIGTPAYMAPEQLMGETSGRAHRHLRVRRHPGGDAVGTASARWPGASAPAVEPPLQRIADRARQPDPNQALRQRARTGGGARSADRHGAPIRPRSAAAVARALRALLVGVPPGRGGRVLCRDAGARRGWRAAQIGGLEGRGFFIATAVRGAVASMLRLHLWFMSRQHAGELAWARRRSAPFIRLADILLVVSLVIGAGLVAAQSVARRRAARARRRRRDRVRVHRAVHRASRGT